MPFLIRWMNKCCCCCCWIAVFLVLVTRPAVSWTTTPLSSSSPLSAIPKPEHHDLFPFLSILIPAYNEQDRLGKTLETYQNFLASHDYWGTSVQRCQIVVADDGSTDHTAALVQSWSSQGMSIPISCVSLPQNAGKGAALAFGMAHILQQRPDGWILTTDADGSAPLEDNLNAVIQCVEEWYENSNSSDTPCSSQSRTKSILVAGYRTYASAAPSRLVFRWGFRTVVRTVVGDLGVRDSQCGFKLVSATAAACLYPQLHLPGWSHDVEVLYRAARDDDTVVLEQAVTWQDQDGSQLVKEGVLLVCAKMFWQVIQLQWNYATGNWKLPESSELQVRTATEKTP